MQKGFIDTKIKNARILLGVLLFLQIILCVMKVKLSVYHVASEAFGVAILISVIANMNFCDCVIYFITTLFNLFLILIFMGEIILKYHRSISLKSPQILISYICLGFYTISLVFVFYAYRVAKQKSYNDLYYNTIINDSTKQISEKLQQSINVPQTNQSFLQDIANNKSIQIDNKPLISNESKISQQNSNKKPQGLFSGLENYQQGNMQFSNIFQQKK